MQSARAHFEAMTLNPALRTMAMIMNCDLPTDPVLLDRLIEAFEKNGKGEAFSAEAQAILGNDLGVQVVRVLDDFAVMDTTIAAIMAGDPENTVFLSVRYAAIMAAVHRIAGIADEAEQDQVALLVASGVMRKFSDEFATVFFSSLVRLAPRLAATFRSTHYGPMYREIFDRR